MNDVTIKRKNKKVRLVSVISLMMLIYFVLVPSAFAAYAVSDGMINSSETIYIQNTSGSSQTLDLFFESSSSIEYSVYSQTGTLISGPTTLNVTSSPYQFTETLSTYDYLSITNTGGASRTYDISDTNQSSFTVTTTEPTGTDPETTDPGTTDPVTTGSMFSGLTTTSITSNATTWASNFDSVLLVTVGVGVAFACVRFVKGLFF